MSKIVLSGSDIEYIPHSLAKFASLTEVKMDSKLHLSLIFSPPFICAVIVCLWLRGLFDRISLDCKKLTLLPSLFAKTPLISVAQCPNLCYPPKSICKTNDMHKIQRFLQKAVLWKRLKVFLTFNAFLVFIF